MRVVQLGAVALSLMMAGPVLAQEDQFGGWSVVSRSAPRSSVAVSCTLTMLANPKGPNISITNQPLQGDAAKTAKQGPAVMRFAVPDKALPDRQATLAGVSAGIEGQKSWSGLEATWTLRGEAGFLQAKLDDDIQAILKPLARGAQFDVGFTPPGGAEKTYSVSLKGSGAAIGAYQDCLAQIR